VNHINKPTRYAANLQTPKTPDSVIAPVPKDECIITLIAEATSSHGTASDIRKGPNSSKDILLSGSVVLRPNVIIACYPCFRKTNRK